MIRQAPCRITLDILTANYRGDSIAGGAAARTRSGVTVIVGWRCCIDIQFSMDSCRVADAGWQGDAGRRGLVRSLNL